MAKKKTLGEALAFLLKKARFQVVIQADMAELGPALDVVGPELKEAEEKGVRFLTLVGPDYKPEDEERVAIFPDDVYLSRSELPLCFVLADERTVYFKGNIGLPDGFRWGGSVTCQDLLEDITRRIADKENVILLRSAKATAPSS